MSGQLTLVGKKGKECLRSSFKFVNRLIDPTKTTTTVTATCILVVLLRLLPRCCIKASNLVVAVVGAGQLLTVRSSFRSQMSEFLSLPPLLGKLPQSYCLGEYRKKHASTASMKLMATGDGWVLRAEFVHSSNIRS